MDQRWMQRVIAQLEGNLPQQQACACERKLTGAIAATPGGDEARYAAALQLHKNSRAKPYGTYGVTLCEVGEPFLRAARYQAPPAVRDVHKGCYVVFKSPLLTGMPSIDRIVNSDDMDLKESYRIDSVPAADRVTCLSVFWQTGARVIIHEFADGFVHGCVKPICNLLRLEHLELTHRSSKFASARTRASPRRSASSTASRRPTSSRRRSPSSPRTSSTTTPRRPTAPR